MKPTSAAAAARLTLYGDEQLQAIPYTRLGRTPCIVSDLLLAGSAPRRQQVVRGLLHDAGFEWLAYGTELHQPDGEVVGSFLTTYAHTPWSTRYLDEAHHTVDPRHLEAPASGLPLVWDMADLVDSARGRQSSVHTQRFLDDMGDSGVRSGVFFHVASQAATQQRTVLSLTSSRPGRGWISDDVMMRALTLGLCLHDFLTHHMQRQEPPGADPVVVALSPRQQDILRCLSRGQSDKQIANGLQLSSHTVDYHMRTLRRRFAVRNRVQLVNAAN